MNLSSISHLVHSFIFLLLIDVINGFLISKLILKKLVHGSSNNGWNDGWSDGWNGGWNDKYVVVGRL